MVFLTSSSRVGAQARCGRALLLLAGAECQGAGGLAGDGTALGPERTRETSFTGLVAPDNDASMARCGRYWYGPIEAP